MESVMDLLGKVVAETFPKTFDQLTAAWQGCQIFLSATYQNGKKYTK
jgi:hypothetical protein